MPSRQLITVYNSILKVAEKQVQYYSPHLNLNKYNIPSNITEEKLLIKLSDLNNFISHPYYSHLYLRNPNNKN